jgi:hypothetical protein
LLSGWSGPERELVADPVAFVTHTVAGQRGIFTQSFESSNEIDFPEFFSVKICLKLIKQWRASLMPVGETQFVCCRRL